MSFFSDKWTEALETGEYICPKCGSIMEFEDEWEETLVCMKCGYDEDIDHYGFTDEEYNQLYPREEDL